MATGHRGANALSNSAVRILEPFSDKLASLILLVSEAKRHHRPIPNITDGAVAVVKAADHLVAVGNDAMVEGDAILQVAMTGPCEEVQKAAKEFAAAANGLLVDPFSNAERIRLISGIRGMLMGTTDILLQYDLFEVRKITGLAQFTLQSLTKIAGDVLGCEALDEVEAISEASAELLTLISDRAPDMQNSDHSEELIAAGQRLQLSVPVLTGAIATELQVAEVAARHSHSPRLFGVSEAKGALEEIKRVMAGLGPKVLHFHNKDGNMCSMIDRIAVVDDLSASGLSPILEESRDLAIAIEASRSSITDDETHNKHLDSINKITNELAVAIKSTVSDVQNSFVQSSEIHNTLKRLRHAVREGVVAEWTLATMESHDSTGKLLDAAHNEKEMLNDRLLEFEHGTLHLVSSARLLSRVTSDSRKVNSIDTIADRLEGFSEQICLAVAIEQETDLPDAAEQTQLLAKTYTKDVKMMEGVIRQIVRPDEFLSADFTYIQSVALTAKKAALHGYPAAARAAVRKLLKRTDAVVGTAVHEIENSEDDIYRDSINSAKEGIEIARPALAAATKVLNQAGLEARDEATVSFCRALAEMVDRIKVLCQVVEPDAIVDSRLKEETQSAVKMKDDTVKDQVLDGTKVGSEKSEEDPSSIFANAPMLKTEVTKWREEGNEIVSIATEIEECMSMMSQIQQRRAVTDESMGDIITVSKTIASKAKVLVKEATFLRGQCSDKRIKADLDALCERIPTLAVQLTIVSSVKATQTGAVLGAQELSSDTDGCNQMLIDISNNIFTSVSEMVRVCESASLKTIGKIPPRCAFLPRI